VKNIDSVAVSLVRDVELACAPDTLWLPSHGKAFYVLCLSARDHVFTSERQRRSGKRVL